MNMKCFIVARLSNIDEFNSQTKYMGEMDIGRDGFKNVLEYVDLVKLTIIIFTFP